jgi:hypothetical protein
MFGGGDLEQNIENIHFVIEQGGGKLYGKGISFYEGDMNIRRYKFLWEKVLPTLIIPGLIGGLILAFGLKKGWLIFTRIAFIVSCLFLLIVIIMIGFLVLPDLFSRWISLKYRLKRRGFQDFLLKQVRILRRLGFFQSEQALSDEDLCKQLTTRIKDQHGNWVGNLVKYPVLIAAMDETRVYWGDTECDIGKDNNAFIGILNDWASISRGLFKPERIIERWAEDEKSVIVEFQLNGTSCQMKPETMEDYLDLNILKKVNKSIVNTGGQFYIATCNYGQDYSLVFLTKEEKAMLTREAGWRWEKTVRKQGDE